MECYLRIIAFNVVIGCDKKHKIDSSLRKRTAKDSLIIVYCTTGNFEMGRVVQP